MIMPTPILRRLHAGDIPEIAAAFAALGWNKPASQYENYLAQQEAGKRDVIVAFYDGAFAGYLNVVWESGYPPFRQSDIPEIVDFNVLPHLRRRGIGSRLMDEAERVAATRSAIVGIGVGMDPDYGAAQRLYVQRGYIPDGRGLSYQDHLVVYDEPVRVDDSLVLHFTKRLR